MGDQFWSTVTTLFLDNCATHRFLGGNILCEWLDDIGCVLVYLPSYSPVLNLAEFVFKKLKTILKRIEYRELLRDNVHLGVYKGVKQVTAADMCGFLREKY
jgi:transposase